MEEDYTELGRVTIDTAGRTYGPFTVDRGTYKDLLRQWRNGATGDGMVTVRRASGHEHNYRCDDVTAINWRPGR